MTSFSRCMFAAIGALVGASVVFAAPPVYQPAGAPADPKVTAGRNHNRDYAATTELIKQLATYKQLKSGDGLYDVYGSEDDFFCMSARYVRWIVQGTGPYEITARSVKGGVAKTTAP